MTTKKLDAKIEKWKHRPLRHLTTNQLNELVADLREETDAIVDETKIKKKQHDAFLKRIMSKGD